MHDPFALLDGHDAPPLTPWESLATQARALAELADQCAARAASSLSELEPTDDSNPLVEIDALARGLVGAAAACRRAVWQELVDDGVVQAEIARRWGVERSRVNQALRRPDRPR